MSEKERLIELIDDFGDDVTLCDVCSRPREDCEGCTNEQLAEYLVENGVIAPPVMVGQTVYYVYLNKIVEYQVSSIVILRYTQRLFVLGRSQYFEFSDFGKTVFLTKEEALKALKGGAV